MTSIHPKSSQGFGGSNLRGGFLQIHHQIKVRIQVPPHLLQAVLFSSWVNISQPQEFVGGFAGSRKKTKRLEIMYTTGNTKKYYTG